MMMIMGGGEEGKKPDGGMWNGDTGRGGKGKGKGQWISSRLIFWIAKGS